MSASSAGAERSRRLFVYNGGFLTQPRIRRILSLAGWEVRLGAPGAEDAVGVWGASPTSPRGEAVARWTDTPVVRVEDAFLRSLFPGRSGEPTLGLLIDRSGVHFDPEHPSDLETLLATHPLDDPALLDRARAGMEFFRQKDLSKFAATDPEEALPEGPFALVIDQTAGDASVAASGATAETFHEMAAAARSENPGLPIVIKTHPETGFGHRNGHFGEIDGAILLDTPVSPSRLFARAERVYTVSSGLGFEAILHGHRPEVWGGPFYAGWGLTDDRRTFERRGRALAPEQLFAAAMLLYPTWYDPYRDSLAPYEDVARALDAMARAWRDDRHGWTASAMSRWKRPHLDRFFGRQQPVRYLDQPAPGTRHMVWAGKAAPEAEVIRTEDGFLRSRGLGAALTPPLSLVLDDLGIYYDPGRESRLERLIAASVDLSQMDLARADALIRAICDAGITKYTSGGPVPDLPDGHRILVPGQVPDDKGLVTAAGDIRDDAALLAATRERNPDAVLVYKPHPDVLAGYRQGGAVPGEADVTLGDVDPAGLFPLVNEVWTMTSLTGFEALLRGLPVTTTGAPFYAGWGLTTDLGAPPARRRARPTLAGLAHAALIDYPRYSDPVTSLPMPPEAAVHRLAEGPLAAPSGLLARLQGLRARLRRRSI